MEKSKLNLCGLIAEFFGTMLLVVFGAGIASKADTLWAASIAFGLVLMALIVTLWPVSGGHFNPAVSIGLLISKKIDLKNFLLYVVVQFLGAIAGGALLLLFFKDGNAIGANGLNAFLQVSTNHSDTGFMLIALLVELIATFMFVLTIIMTVNSEKNSSKAFIIIPLALTLALMLARPFTGGSANPARSFGTMIFADSFKHVWIVIVGPVLGAVLAGFTSLILLKHNKKNEQAQSEAH